MDVSTLTVCCIQIDVYCEHNVISTIPFFWTTYPELIAECYWFNQSENSSKTVRCHKSHLNCACILLAKKFYRTPEKINGENRTPLYLCMETQVKTMNWFLDGVIAAKLLNFNTYQICLDMALFQKELPVTCVYSIVVPLLSPRAVSGKHRFTRHSNRSTYMHTLTYSNFMCFSHYYCYWVFLVFGGDKTKSKKNVESIWGNAELVRMREPIPFFWYFFLVVRTSHWLIDCVGQSLYSYFGARGNIPPGFW